MNTFSNLPFPVIADNGDAWSTPACTKESLWSALGAGAQGLCLNVFATKDAQLVCTPVAIPELTQAQVQSLDAGKSWRSSLLDDEGQPTGDKGEDNPWAHIDAKTRKIFHPTIADCLQQFGRRTALYLRLPSEADEHLINNLLALLRSFGLSRRVMLIATPATVPMIRASEPRAPIALDVTQQPLNMASLDKAITMEPQCLYAYAEDFVVASNQADLVNLVHNADLRWLLSTQKTFRPTNLRLQQLEESRSSITGLIVPGVLPTIETLTPPATVLADSFDGTDLNSDQWTAGYSHANQDTQIYQNDGFTIQIRQGGSYSGGAAVTKLPIHGDFDAQVDFEVAHPHQGTTFEMAAISIDPGYLHMDNGNLDSRSVNLTFDVHGAPPYASSERDENDGFRCGWNNGYNLTKVGDVIHDGNDIKIEPWTASSINMYNKYGRDVGYGKADSPTGTLRLVRHGQVFNTYYKDKFNAAWVCSGSVLVQNIHDDAFIRLAAKHWKKSNPEPPHNKVTFRNFVLRQY